MTRQVKAHIRLGIHSVSPSDQSPRCPHEEILGPYLPIAKFRGISPRNVAEFLRELSRSFSAKCHGENSRRNKSFLFFSAKIFISPKGCLAPKREKKAFYLGWSVTTISFFPSYGCILWKKWKYNLNSSCPLVLNLHILSKWQCIWDNVYSKDQNRMPLKLSRKLGIQPLSYKLLLQARKHRGAGVLSPPSWANYFKIM